MVGSEFAKSLPFPTKAGVANFFVCKNQQNLPIL
jgi:hypothetical protein